MNENVVGDAKIKKVDSWIRNTQQNTDNDKHIAKIQNACFISFNTKIQARFISKTKVFNFRMFLVLSEYAKSLG